MGLWDGDVGLGMGGDGDGRMGTKGWGLGDRQLVRGDGGKGDSGTSSSALGAQVGVTWPQGPPRWGPRHLVAVVDADAAVDLVEQRGAEQRELLRGELRGCVQAEVQQQLRHIEALRVGGAQGWGGSTRAPQPPAQLTESCAWSYPEWSRPSMRPSSPKLEGSIWGGWEALWPPGVVLGLGGSVQVGAGLWGWEWGEPPGRGGMEHRVG